MQASASGDNARASARGCEVFAPSDAHFEWKELPSPSASRLFVVCGGSNLLLHQQSMGRRPTNGRSPGPQVTLEKRN